MMQRHPLRKEVVHLQFVRGLPCVICGNDIETEAAHIRFACEPSGKRYVGKGEKPDDSWTVPLCGLHHKEHNETEKAAHTKNEHANHTEKTNKETRLTQTYSSKAA